MRTGQEIPGGNGLLRVGPLKVLIDGSLNTRTAYCVDPYPHGGHGLLTVSEAELLACWSGPGSPVSFRRSTRSATPRTK